LIKDKGEKMQRQKKKQIPFWNDKQKKPMTNKKYKGELQRFWSFAPE